MPRDKLIGETASKVGRIELHTGIEVEEINIENRTIYGRRIKSGEKVSEEYDSLIIATGSIPLVPSSISISSMKKVFYSKVSRRH